MPDHIANRDKIIQALREELVGPSPQGKPIKCSGEITFQSDNKDFYQPWKQENGEEILQRDPPLVRYGVGVLHPIETPVENEDLQLNLVDTNIVLNNQPEEIEADEELITESAKQNLEDIEKEILKSSETESDDFDLSTANTYKPSSMGISFLADFPKGSVLVIEATNCGCYRQKKVKVGKSERTWWLRKSINFTVEFTAEELCSVKERKFTKTKKIDGLELSFEVFSRPDREKREGVRLLTVCLINRTTASGGHENCLFQAGFAATIISPKGEAHILPYPKPDFNSDNKEEQSLALLYRKMETYGVGHGCAANWDKEASDGIKTVIAECLPTFETPSITPDIGIEVPMASLAGLIPGDDGFAALWEVVNRYEQWIEDRRNEIISLGEEYQNAAYWHIDECTRAAQRMRNGLIYLQNDTQAKRAFQLANYAILLQQICSRRELRKANYDIATKRYTFSTNYQAPNLIQTDKNSGKWRAFQVAFLLMSIESTAEGDIPDRSTVELIWFPTGGGKTEAYLGLSAFALFMRRLKNPEDVGVNVLMRYTLRLLTAQQFQRASALICAMEYLRRQNENELGKEPFSIGIWVGRETTPNTRTDAISKFNRLQSDSSAENPFLISRCPWCAAQMGRYQEKLPRGIPNSLYVLGYNQSRGTVIFKCPDNACEFHKHNGLPVYVIDEDIYEKRPSLIIGTVDKFALLAWSYAQKARALFGIGADGKRVNSPPGLIIQDELHLISGPLGSVVGLYETVIEELCTDRRNGQEIKPKIVCSTATIRRYADQVKALYGREDVVLFPPPGLDAEDSFFSRYARNSADKTLQRGRVYMGVHAPGLRSLLTAEVRTAAAILQAPVSLTPEERDPWWTLLVFFNSLRELGTTLSLLQSDIPGYLKVIRNRLGLDWQQMRYLLRILELTGRIRSDQVPESINKLEVKCDNSNNQPSVDVCLASNIIEVGVDIDRLSLMAVVGQPKTTSQYIQVTGRVGRRWWERPGLVVTIYSPTRPRDRSHFEKFRSYHSSLYAQVEPTSVTPFSPPVLDRALHAIMTTYVRQTGDEKIAQTPEPYPENLIEQLRDILIPRIQLIDPDEVENFDKVFNKRASEWRGRQRTNWERNGRDNIDIPLIRVAGEYASREWQRLSWATPMSMRNVDAECQAEITNLYLNEGEEEDA
ncbi:helicase [Hassallia byssoidea VB512170]|uniref:Helicase n=1 Tax=Hassallia byssoidea VB512170 TaxID=1304833 RepID=A0A846H8S7_9CYAN|nr:helicase-related protein [Hassalia byssoidea]NEU73109.1 helicase [Hassalia byssoidea VB512170]